MRIFLTGTDTNVGKTVVSSLLVKIFNSDYWKPIQCGDLENSDTWTIQNLLGENYKGHMYPERYKFKAPLSPHLAAEKEAVSIQLNDFELPQNGNRSLIVEGAGGCLAPLNETHGIIDLAKHLDLEVILVTKFYLGAYNHTLLSLEALERRGITIKGLFLNEGDNKDFRDFISRKCKVEFLGIIPKLASWNSDTLETMANQWREHND